MPGSAPAGTGDGLVARGLALRFGERTLFEGLDLQVPPGRTVVVRGPSGSGKSSLLRLIAGLLPPGAGAVTLDGRAPRDLGLPGWRAAVRYVPQRLPTLGGTPAELLARAARFRSWAGRSAGDPRASAQRWGLPGEAWSRPWHELSGGEQQRVLLAVGLAGEPAVLLLDEPTSALDPDAAAAVELDLRGRTALWVTHDRAQAERVGARVLELG